MTGLVVFSVLGLALGLVLAKVAKRGRVLLLRQELERLELEARYLAEAEAALTAYPFGESIPLVQSALHGITRMRKASTDRLAFVRHELGLDRTQVAP